MSAGTIQGSFGFDNSPLVAAMREAPNIAEKGARSVQQRFTDIFRRSPHMRAERALSGALQSFAGGDVAGGIQSITARMTGLGLIAGVAIGAGVEIFQKFREEIIATREAHEALQNEMIKHPVSNVIGLSEAGMKQALEARSKLADELRSKQEKSGFASNVWSGIKSAVGGFGMFQNPKDEGKEQIQVQQDLNKQDVENNTILQAGADLREGMLQIQKQQLFGDKQEAELATIRLETQQKIRALESSGLPADVFAQEKQTIIEQSNLREDMANREHDAKEKSLAFEEKMNGLIKEGLSLEDQKKLRATNDLADLDKQISETSDETRLKELNVRRGQKQNELRAFGKPAGPAENPFAFGTIAARNFESQSGNEFGSIAARTKETENAGAWGSLANSAMNRGESPKIADQKNQPADVVKAIEETNRIIREALK